MELHREIVLAYLDEEMPGAIAWAQSKGLSHTWSRDDLSFSLRLERRSENDGRATSEPYLLRGTFEDYRLEPPTWRFLDPRDAREIGTAAYPEGDWPGGSIFHSNGIICAPWSRDAYSDRGGPHGDWGGARAWTTAGAQYTQATTVPDMLQRIFFEVQRSPRRMASLPELGQAAA